VSVSRRDFIAQLAIAAGATALGCRDTSDPDPDPETPGIDHVIVVNAAGLHRVLTDYVMYYLRSRTHLSLGKDTPSPRPVRPPSSGRIVAIPEVGGLHHRYDRSGA